MSDDRTIPTPAPSDLPSFTVTSGGQAVPGTVRVESVAVHRRFNKVAEAVVVVLDGDVAAEDWPVSNEPTFAPGAEIEVHAGYHSEEELIFRGVAVRHGVQAGGAGAARLTVTCKDAAVRLTVGRKSAVWADVTDADVIDEIASAAGLDADVALDGPTHPELVQLDALDWDFVVARAEAAGALVATDDGTLRVAPPDPAAAPALALRYGGNVIDLALAADARDQLAAVEAVGWDPAEQAVLAMEGADPGVTAPGDLAAADLAAVAGPDVARVRHGGALADAELQAWADAQLLKSRLAQVQGHVRIKGFAEVRPGSTVDLAGVGGRFTGTAFVSGVSHEIRSGSWETVLEIGLDPAWFVASHDDVSAPPAGALVPAARGLSVGVVTALEGDPGEAFRIAVRLPLVSEAGELWARLATLDAGDGRGSVFRPEVGDEVVVGFLGGDPRQPVVLGALHGPAKAPPIDPSDDNHEKGFVTRGGHKITVDDDAGVVTVATEGGQTVTLSDDAEAVTLADAHGNVLVLDADGIRLESAADLLLKASGDVTVEGTNVSASASAAFAAEGGSGSTLESSATTTVKGSLVQIN